MANKAPDKIQPDPELNTLTAEKLLAKKVARKWRVAKSLHNGEHLLTLVGSPASWIRILP
jgi:hypothetical protein